MPETRATSTTGVVARTSPLSGVVKAGDFGSVKDLPRVELSIRHPISIIAVIARKGRGDDLAAALGRLANCSVLWAGFEQYYVLAEGRAEGTLYRDVKLNLGDLGTMSDQSHGRIVIRIAGPRARSVLAKGTPVDLHADEFPVGKSAVTQIAHVGVHLTRTSVDVFDVSIFRGFAESFWEWLTQQSEEFGYRVT
jgi:heterotetrameric sarcosine oxidase gamma subunit